MQPWVEETPVALDEELGDDATRGERSREGFSDADDTRNPVQPSDHGDPPPQTPESGRDRDPELGRERA